MSLTQAQPVVLRLADATELQARVDGLEGGAVRLVLAMAPKAGLHQGGAVVEYYSPTGIHRIAGALEPVGPDPSVVRLRPDAEEVEQRRDFARVDAAVPANVWVEEPEIAFAATVALNVSGGGALIQDPIGLPLGAVIRLQLCFDDEPIEVHGRIVRETSDGAKGIWLDAIADPDRERIIRWVQGRQLIELRLRRDREGTR